MERNQCRYIAENSTEWARRQDQHALRVVTRNSLDTTSCEVGEMEIGIRWWLALMGVGVESLGQGLHAQGHRGLSEVTNILYLDRSGGYRGKFVRTHPTVFL